MSGIFLTVAEESVSPDVSPLQPTKGGYPHVTLVYTGKHKDVLSLRSMAERVFARWISDNGSVLPQLTLTAENAYVNTFFHEGEGKWRHDVLLALTTKDTEQVKALRTDYVASDPKSKKFSMHPTPHVTHSIHWRREAADAALADIRAHMPLVVRVTGYTLD